MNSVISISEYTKYREPARLTVEWVDWFTELKNSIFTATQSPHERIETFKFQPLGKIKKVLFKKYSSGEVTELVDALKELPQYGNKGRGIKKSPK